MILRNPVILKAPGSRTMLIEENLIYINPVGEIVQVISLKALMTLLSVVQISGGIRFLNHS